MAKGEKIISRNEEDVKQRLVRVETDLQGVVASIERLATNVETLFKETRVTNQKLADSQKAPWVPLAAWATVFLTFITAMGTLTVVPIIQVQEKLYENQIRMEKQIADNRVEIARLDERTRMQEKIDGYIIKDIRALEERVCGAEADADNC